MKSRSKFNHLIKSMYNVLEEKEKLPIAKDDSYRKRFNVEIMITHRCNLECKYCCTYPPCKEEPTFKEMKIILDKVHNQIDPDVIFLGGGEPLLREDLFDILNLIGDKYESIIDLFTNGTLLDNNKVKKLKKYQISHPLNLVVSLDSHIQEINDRIRGNYYKIVKGIQKLKRYDVDFAVAIVLTKQNAETILDTLEYFRKFFTKKIHIINLRPAGRSLKNFYELFLRPKEISKIWKRIFNYYHEIAGDIIIYHPFGEDGIEKCSAGRKRCTILPNGDVIPCDMATTFVLGNVYKNNLNEILDKRRIEELTKYPERLCFRNLKNLGYQWPFESKPIGIDIP